MPNLLIALGFSIVLRADIVMLEPALTRMNITHCIKDANHFIAAVCNYKGDESATVPLNRIGGITRRNITPAMFSSTQTGSQFIA